jgi:hypothetical protein
VTAAGLETYHLPCDAGTASTLLSRFGSQSKSSGATMTRGRSRGRRNGGRDRPFAMPVAAARGRRKAHPTAGRWRARQESNL